MIEGLGRHSLDEHVIHKMLQSVAIPSFITTGNKGYVGARSRVSVVVAYLVSRYSQVSFSSAQESMNARIFLEQHYPNLNIKYAPMVYAVHVNSSHNPPFTSFGPI